MAQWAGQTRKRNTPPSATEGRGIRKVPAQYDSFLFRSSGRIAS